MISSTTSLLNYRHALGYLLLLLIAYGSTVETVHSHGTGSPDRHDLAAAVSDTDGSQTSHTGHSHLTECAMCEFQQQLFNGLVHAPSFAVTTSVQIASFHTLSVFLPSTLIERPSGRAPPLS